jgi:hypothetical protein
VFVKTESVYGSSVCPHSTEDGTSDLNEIWCEIYVVGGEPKLTLLIFQQ